ncbi:sensor histidine kinase [Alkalilacustris brevis]|uniref:sensor histidine kinase n=1 Tax=Alkalilacustris brevis TaxID=2026338 RepID=UPI000E0D4878|nr:ATP-binding protein [Alkalilacustris brevis]
MELRDAALLIRDLPEPLLVVGQDHAIRATNRAAEEMLGSGLVGQSAFGAIRQPEAVSALEQGLRAAGKRGDDKRTDGSPRTSEARFVQTTAGAAITFRMVVVPLAPETGLDGVMISFHDISHVEEAEQMRRDFVANVSHELRSPLTALSGFIETLRGPARGDPAATDRFLEIMAQESSRMGRLVADLLTLSRVEVSERIRPRDMVSPADILRATIAALRPQIEEASLRLDFTPGDESLRVLGDRDQLVQVFRNLLENALKYGASGGVVRLTMRRHARMPGFSGPVVAIEVADEGPGIDPLHIPRLTERFYRVDTHRSREKGGTGLGLAIVKHIVNRHRGRLTIQSTPGKGSTFTVLLPAAP